MRPNFDLTPFRRATVGYERLIDLLENGIAGQSGEDYPPFDLEQQADDRYRITLAVAGFRPDEIDITAQQNLLVVTGRKREPKSGSYIHRGIAARAFERRFVLGDYVQVRSADLRDGLLSIDLVREIPEEMRPRRIEIRQSGGAERLDDRRDAGEGEQSDQRIAA